MSEQARGAGTGARHAATGVRAAGRAAKPTAGVDSESVKVTVESITFRAEDTGYCVLKATSSAGAELTAVGTLPQAEAGMRLTLHGEWTHHPRFGRQFRVKTYSEDRPATKTALRRYLGSGLLRGVGPSTAKLIVDHFGLAALEILETDPDRLTEVPGIGPIKAERIARSWREQQSVKELMLYLQNEGVSPRLGVRIHRQYGLESLAVVQREPYRIARDIRGIGFLTADRLAQRLGIEPNSPERIAAGVLHNLGELAASGHTHPPVELAISTAAELLEVDATAVASAVDSLSRSRDVIFETTPPPPSVALPRFHRAETGAAAHVAVLASATESRLPEFASQDPRPLLKAVESQLPHRLAERQRSAVVMALKNRVSVLTGGPGTGKTTTLRALLLLSRKHKVALGAPTGRAAKRLAEATGLEAMTLHRLLEFDPTNGGFKRDESRPIEADLFVIDEASMIDIALFYALVRAIKPGSHLLLVGDADQLPSVGPGNVLADLIASNIVPVVRLDEIFRQAAESQIVANSHLVRRGEMPAFGDRAGDSYFFRIEDAERAATMLLDVVAEKIPSRFGFNAVSDIQVLVPMHRGPMGVAALNVGLQARLNPPSPGRSQLDLGDRILRTGDRVMQTRNNYDLDVFNGDVGRVLAVDADEGIVSVRYDDVVVDYTREAVEDVALAYACSIHKSQGSEFPVVVMGLVPGHYLLLQRNLLYTGMTRARQLFVLVGSQRALATAVSNASGTERHTRLAWRLGDAFSKVQSNFREN